MVMEKYFQWHKKFRKKKQTVFGEGHVARVQVDVAADGVVHRELLFKRNKREWNNGQGRRDPIHFRNEREAVRSPLRNYQTAYCGISFPSLRSRSRIYPYLHV